MAKFNKTLVFRNGVERCCFLEIRQFDSDNELVVVSKRPDATEEHYYLTVDDVKQLIDHLQEKLFQAIR